MAARQDLMERRTLWIVLALNIGLAVAFFATGAFGDSSALIANGLDNLSDSFVYAISLFALSRSAKWKRGAANVSGGLLILFAAGIFYDAWRRYIGGSDPLGTIMIAMALIAAAINAVCVWLLAKLKIRTSTSARPTPSVTTISPRTSGSSWPVASSPG